MRYKVLAPMRYGRKSYAKGQTFSAHPDAVLDSYRRLGFIAKEAPKPAPQPSKVKAGGK